MSRNDAKLHQDDGEEEEGEEEEDDDDDDKEEEVGWRLPRKRSLSQPTNHRLSA